MESSHQQLPTSHHDRGLASGLALQSGMTALATLVYITLCIYLSVDLRNPTGSISHEEICWFFIFALSAAVSNMDCIINLFCIHRDAGVCPGTQ